MSKISHSKGFTLIELAIVTLILAFLLSSAFLSVSALRKTSNIKKAQQKLSEIEEALYGFAIANGRLPCPATPGSGLANPADPSGLAGTQRNCNLSANINGFIGFVPSATLGIKGEVNCDSLLVDPWGRPYRYSVTNVDAGTTQGGDFVVANGIQEENTTTTPPDGMSIVNPDILICNNLDAACNTATAGNIVTSSAVAVIFSMGEPGTNSAVENENAGERNIASTCGLGNYPLGNDQRYYSAPSREDPAVASTKFDDIVTWISPNTLFSKLLSAGRLP